MSESDDEWQRYLAWQVEVLRVLAPVLPQPEPAETPAREWLRALSATLDSVPESLRGLVADLTTAVARAQSPLVGGPATAASEHTDSMALDLGDSGQIRLTMSWNSSVLTLNWDAVLEDEVIVAVILQDEPRWAARLPIGDSTGELKLVASAEFNPLVDAWSLVVFADPD